MKAKTLAKWALFMLLVNLSFNLDDAVKGDRSAFWLIVAGVSALVALGMLAIMDEG